MRFDGPPEAHEGLRKVDTMIASRSEDSSVGIDDGLQDPHADNLEADFCQELYLGNIALPIGPLAAYGSKDRPQARWPLRMYFRYSYVCDFGLAPAPSFPLKNSENSLIA